MKPDVSGFRPFGVPVYYHLTSAERDMKADTRWHGKAARGINLGLSNEVPNAYYILPDYGKRIITRRDVVAVEGDPMEAIDKTKLSTACKTVPSGI